MKSKLILLFILSFYINSGAHATVIHSTKTFEQNGASLTEHLTITLPENFNRQIYKSIVQKIGYIYQPHSQVIHEKILKDIVLYKTRYFIGDYGLRILPPELLNTKAPNHLIMAGDSNVFSEGCLDADSITVQLSRELPQFDAYNFGHRGGGPHNTLSMMEHYPFWNLIKEKKGVFIYNFFTGHMYERVVGAKNYIVWDTGRSPYYALDNHDVAQYQGSFNKRFITKIYKFISAHPFLNDLLPVLPQINADHIKLISKIFVKMKSLYLRSFPEGKFIVIINNSYVFFDKDTETLKLDLKKEGIETMEIPYMGINKKQFIFKDMHLNPRGQKIQSKIIADQLLKILSLH
ncbi:MAG: hypothetical protein PHY93_11030 [Bacteriovorax sp.]|nr:hypothetical protein [Bacteriovorax sp.]